MANISKIYTKAFLEVANESEIENAFKNLKILFSLKDDKKFKEIINSPCIDNNKKFDFLLSLLEDPSKHFINFLKLLIKNARLKILKDIFLEFQKEISFSKNIHSGLIFAKNEIKPEKIKLLEDKFSKKLNTNIEFNFIKSDFNGLKIKIPDLSLEVSFSMDKLKSQLDRYLLKAI